jgi:hypothetical protein
MALTTPLRLKVTLTLLSNWLFLQKNLVLRDNRPDYPSYSMKNCDCEPYLKEATLPMDFQKFKEKFEVKELQGGPGWAIGTCTCKRCGENFDWDYENLIYEKLSLRIKR